MLHNELEYRNAKKQLDGLRAEIQKRSLAVEREIPGDSRAVVEALKMKISDIEHEIAEYENLKGGLVSSFRAGDLDELGEIVTKARIARRWSQADLAEALGTHHQQIQRYERNDWQKINLWRLQEVVEVLRLRLNIHAHLEYEVGNEDEVERPSASWPRVISAPHHHAATYGGQALTANKESEKALTVDKGSRGASRDQPAGVPEQSPTEPMVVV